MNLFQVISLELLGFSGRQTVGEIAQAGASTLDDQTRQAFRGIRGQFKCGVPAHGAAHDEPRAIVTAGI